jgi:hypothetical protein
MRACACGLRRAVWRGAASMRMARVHAPTTLLHPHPSMHPSSSCCSSRPLGDPSSSPWSAMRASGGSICTPPDAAGAAPWDRLQLGYGRCIEGSAVPHGCRCVVSAVHVHIGRGGPRRGCGSLRPCVHACMCMARGKWAPPSAYIGRAEMGCMRMARLPAHAACCFKNGHPPWISPLHASILCLLILQAAEPLLRLVRHAGLLCTFGGRVPGCVNL